MVHINRCKVFRPAVGLGPTHSQSINGDKPCICINDQGDPAGQLLRTSQSSKGLNLEVKQGEVHAIMGPERLRQEHAGVHLA